MPPTTFQVAYDCVKPITFWLTVSLKIVNTSSWADMDTIKQSCVPFHRPWGRALRSAAYIPVSNSCWCGIVVKQTKNTAIASILETTLEETA